MLAIPTDAFKVTPPTQSAAATAAPSSDVGNPLRRLLLEIAAGDQVAFKKLYVATSPRLFALARLYMKRSDLAEDVLQDAYLRIWSCAKSYDPLRGAPMPWLATIVRNAAINHLRADRGTHDDIADHVDRLVATEVPTGDRLDLTRGLAALSPHHRHAVLLSFLHGHTNEEVAQRMVAPLGTAKAWIRRGAQRMRQQLAT